MPLDDLRPIAFPEDCQAMAAADERFASARGHWHPSPGRLTRAIFTSTGNLDGLGMHVEKLMTGVLPYLLEVVTFHACDRDHVGIAEV